MKVKITILSFFFLCFIKAQDIHFSQIHASPIFLNPAMTGVFNEELRLIANYRNQWATATANFNTISASVDGKLFSMGKHASMNFGVQAFTDAAGDLNYRQTNFQVPLAANLQFGSVKSKNKHLLSFGIQNGFLHQTADLSKIEAFDNEPLIGSLFSTNRIVYDVSFGAVWTSLFNNKHSFYIGYSQYHLNTPKVNTSSNNDNDFLHMKFITIGGAEIMLKSEKYAFLPSYINMIQGPHREVTVGTFFKQYVGERRRYEDRNALYYGVWARWYANKNYNSGFDALIATFRYDHKKLSLAFSYDFTLSKLTVANKAQGGAELSLIYLVDIKTKKRPNKQVYCPKF
ncbi:MAG: PorP/SprF family type IX secretion system membrane protein [Chitinophagales bacterium]